MLESMPIISIKTEMKYILFTFSKLPDTMFMIKYKKIVIT